MAQVTLQVRPAQAAPVAKGADFESDLQQAQRHFRSLSNPLDRYIYLRNLTASNPHAYYEFLYKDTEEILPFIYTPTVGDACEQYHKLPLKTRGLYISLNDKGNVLSKLKSWAHQDVAVVVVTDGERILGLGDLGANGMGISEGKITLYTAAAGVNPMQCLPVCLDVGTNNQALLDDPQYKGLRQRRCTGTEYDAFVEEFVTALQQWRPHVLLQFEDFGNNNAFRLLEKYRSRLCCFNDDIQGTACITLAGILSALRVSGQSLADQRVMFLGAGEAGTGIGELIAEFLQTRHGLSQQAAREHCFFLDSKGLVCASRTDLQHHKKPFAHDVPFQRTLKDAIAALKPTVLIGVSTIAGAFDADVISAMCANTPRPIVFPLSNPTSKSECTFAQAHAWSKGQVLFASGSPFDPLSTAEGTTLYPAQANNAYIFPAVGHAAVLTGCSSITGEVFLSAAEALAAMTPAEDLAQGRLFPAFSTIRSVSVKIIAQIAQHIVGAGLGTCPEGASQQGWERFAQACIWSPTQLPTDPSSRL